MPTLISPDGRPYRTGNLVEIKRLVNGQGYRVEGGDDGDLFDPGKHSVKEVKSYIEENPDDAERVLDAERAGQARTTLVGD